MLLVNREMKENHPVVINRLGHFAVGDLSSLSWVKVAKQRSNYQLHMKQDDSASSNPPLRRFIQAAI
jgi:hypothetical protein